MALVLAVVACQRRDEVSYPFDNVEAPFHYSVFAKANTFMTLQPDSAMRILMAFHDSVDIRSLKRPDYFEFMLLATEISTKGPADSFLMAQNQRINHFYDSLHHEYPSSEMVDFLLAKSYYCIANYEEKSDRPIAACDSYFKALGLAEKVNAERFPLVNEFLALAYNKIGVIYYNNESWSIAIDNLKKANIYFDRNHIDIGTAFNLETIGEIFYQAGNQDSALVYFREADAAISSLSDVEIGSRNRQTLVNNQARTLFSVGEKERAYAMLYEAIAAQTEEMERKPYYGLLAELYFMDHLSDSALHYYEKSFPFDPYERTRLLNNMISLCNEMGNYEKAAYYATFLGEEVERSKTKLALVQHYENHVKDVELQSQHQISVQHNLKNAGVMFVVFAAIVIVMLLFYKRLKKLLLSNKTQHQQSMKEKENELKRKELELEMTKKKLSFEEKPGDYAGRMQQLEQSHIVHKIKSLVEKEDVMTKNLKGGSTPLLKERDLVELVKAVNGSFDDLTTILVKNYPRLTSNDIRYCCLFFLNLKQKEVAALMGISQSGINQKHRRLQQVFGTNDSVSSFLSAYFKEIYG